MRQSVRSFFVVPALAVAGLALLAPAVSAQAISLPDTNQTTVLTATVGEQARVTIPSGVTFSVSDISSATAASAASVTVSNIVLASATKQLKVSLQADAASFTAPPAGGTTWAASDVTWNAATWTSATGAAGTLSDSAYNTVATCAANAASCSTGTLVFTLGAKPTVQRSGNHQLTVRWKVEAIGS